MKEHWESEALYEGDVHGARSRVGEEAGERETGKHRTLRKE
jgi:hypothetical protein